MFIFTARFNPKKTAVFLILALALLSVIVLAAVKLKGAETGAGPSLQADSNEKRVEYLSSFGWQVDDQQVEEQQVLIPREFSQVYEAYNDIQLGQGFDLKNYAGLDATRYTYKVTNYPGGESNVYADLIVYSGRVIAGDIRSAALDGFIHGLEMP